MPSRPVVINDTLTGGFVVNYNATPYISNPFESTMDGQVPYGYLNNTDCNTDIVDTWGVQTRFVAGTRTPKKRKKSVTK